MKSVNLAGEIDIDSISSFFNPFNELKSEGDSSYLYEKYFKHPRNRRLLKEIGNKNIITKDRESYYSRKSILERLASFYKFRTVKSNSSIKINQLQKGIIINHLPVESSLENSGIFYELSKIYPQLQQEYNNHKIKSSGTIQACNIKDDLYIINLFSESAMVPTDSYRSIRRSFLKAKHYINKINKNDLQIYSTTNNGDKMCFDIAYYSKLLRKHFPTIILCEDN